MSSATKKWGYLRETSEAAQKAGIDKNGLHRTGLDEYLKVIFPEAEWNHDKIVPGLERRTRPDYRCEERKLIVEFDGLPHYTNPLNIKKDIEKTKLYQDAGYKVVRIPYFIQLTNDVIKTLFDVGVTQEMFDHSIPSLSVSDNNTPAFLCPAGIKRMAKEFRQFQEQFDVNLAALKKEKDQELAGTDLLIAEYNKILSQNDIEKNVS